MVRADDDGVDITESAITDTVEFSDFTDSDAALWKRVDFLGIIATVLKSWVSAVFALFGGIFLAFERSFGGILDAVAGFYSRSAEELASGFGEAQSEATRIAAEEVAGFGLFSLTVGQIVVISSILSAVLILYFFVWGET